MSRLRELYDNEITKKMTEKFGYKNPMMVPKIDKIVINMGVGEGMDVIITTTAKTDEEARELLRLFNMPFKK